MSRPNKISYRVYYEDTDSGGVVYYANYLKFAERARTEILRINGINQSELAKTEDIFFVVRHVEMDLHKPARLDDMLDITTSVAEIGGASITLHQQIKCNDLLLADIKVLIVAVNGNMKPVRLKGKVREAFGDC